MSDEERLLKLELALPQIKVSIEKILEAQDSLTALKIESQESKKFRDAFDSEVRRIVRQVLDTKDFDKAISLQIEEVVMVIFNKPEVRKDLGNTIDSRIDSKWKDRKLGWITAFISAVVGIVIGLISFWARGAIK
jgi:hypothetical protein